MPCTRLCASVWCASLRTRARPLSPTHPPNTHTHTYAHTMDDRGGPPANPCSVRRRQARTHTPYTNSTCGAGDAPRPALGDGRAGPSCSSSTRARAAAAAAFACCTAGARRAGAVAGAAPDAAFRRRRRCPGCGTAATLLERGILMPSSAVLAEPCTFGTGCVWGLLRQCCMDACLPSPVRTGTCSNLLAILLSMVYLSETAVHRMPVAHARVREQAARRHSVERAGGLQVR